MNVFTIGFTKKSARHFFHLLRASGARRIIDVRLNNASQLAGFAKRDDLSYFVQEICKMDYVCLPQLAPTQDLLSDYRKKLIDWETYENRFMELMRERRIEETTPKEVVENGCLLCSEDQPHHCHRRLVAEYLGQQWGDDWDIVHLGEKNLDKTESPASQPVAHAF